MSDGGWRHRYRSRRRLCAAGFLGLLAWGGGNAAAPVHGALSAARWFDAVPFVDPLSSLEVLLASGKATGTLLLGGGLALAVGAVLGRVFCGWLCPLGLVLEVNAALRELGRRLVKRAGRRRHEGAHRLPVPAEQPPQAAAMAHAARCHDTGSGDAAEAPGVAPSLRYWLLAGTLAASAGLSIPVFTALAPINAVAWAVVFGVWPAVIAVVGLCVGEWFWPRSFCRAICPLGAFYTIIGRRARFGVRIDPATAGKYLCGQCSIGCPMGIGVMEHFVAAGKRMVDDPSCTRCGACIDRCPGGVLTLGFGVPVARPAGCLPGAVSRPLLTSPGSDLVGVQFADNLRHAPVDEPGHQPVHEQQ